MGTKANKQELIARRLFKLEAFLDLVKKYSNDPHLVRKAELLSRTPELAAPMTMVKRQIRKPK